jgi:pimeloyl-ACP methyl ester carboxylesterase
MNSPTLVRSLIALALLVVISSPAHAMLEGSFLYLPSHAPNQSQLAEWRIDGKVVGYSRTVPSPRSIWLILHGNAGQASDRQYIVNRLPADSSAYILEYPGYGARLGKPSMASINTAAREAYVALRSLHPGIPFGVFGESVGSGPASFLCSLPNPPDRLVLVVPFDNLLSVAKRHMKLLPVSLLLRDKWNNVKALAGYKGPVEIFAAKNDTVIPAEHARNLAQSVPQARYIELPGGHNDWSLNSLTQIRD